MKYGKIVYVLRIKGGLELKKIYVDMENKKMCICHTNNIELINLDKILEYEIIFEKNEDMVDRELYAFIEGKVADENAYVGRTYRDAPSIDGYIFVNTEETLMTGDFAKVKVTGAYEYDLIGELA